MNTMRRRGEPEPHELDPRSVTYDDLLQRYTPMIYMFARRADPLIDGYELEDLAQELRLLLWDCQRRYQLGTISRKSTGNGRPSRFTGYFAFSCLTTMQKIQAREHRFHRPAVGRRCTACGAEGAAHEVRRPCGCTDGRWELLRSKQPFSNRSLDVPGLRAFTSDEELVEWDQLLHELSSDKLRRAAINLIYHGGQHVAKPTRMQLAIELRDREPVNA